MCQPWGAQIHTRKTPEMSQTRNGKGCKRHPALVPVDPCMVATKASTLCNPFPATQKQPFAQNLYPRHQKCYPKATKMVAVSQKGWHRNCRPPNPGQPSQLPTYMRNAVATAVEFWVSVRMAMDTHDAITDG